MDGQWHMVTLSSQPAGGRGFRCELTVPMYPSYYRDVILRSRAVMELHYFMNVMNLSKQHGGLLLELAPLRPRCLARFVLWADVRRICCMWSCSMEIKWCKLGCRLYIDGRMVNQMKEGVSYSDANGQRLQVRELPARSWEAVLLFPGKDSRGMYWCLEAKP